ncbi:MAG: hypothetical protein DRI65_09865 [Chloroflexota bacterium]|nr:MAG: hypothetical protein DRI65_09865 [Chloroflexota bacterium]HDD62267.1 PAS domain S-box protein [Chloroflexota bacterium]
MKLSTKITLLIITLALVPSIVLGNLAYVNGRQIITRQTNEQLTSISTLKESEFNRWINDNKRILRTLAQRPLIREFTAVQTRSGITSQDPDFQNAQSTILADHLVPALEDKGGFLDFAIIGLNGQILTATDRELEGKFRSGALYLKEGMKDTYVDGVIFNLSEGQYNMHISTPILDDVGHTIAVLVGHADLEDMASIIINRSGGAASENNYLVNSYNFFVTDPVDGEGYALTTSVYSEGVENCLTGNSGTAVYDNYQDMLVLGSYRWMPDYGMCLLTEVDYTEAFAPIESYLATMLGLIFVIAVIALFLGLIISHTISEPIQELVEGSLEFGSGNLDYRINIKGKDEMSALAQSFNQMASSLRLITASRDELDNEISERKNAEEHALKERDKAQRYLDVAGTIFVVIDPNETVSLINKAGCEMLGAESDEIIGQNWFENYIPQRIRSETREVFKLLMEGKIEPTEYFENPVCTKDGLEKIIAWHNTYLTDEKGVIQGTLSSGEDVTERRKAEGELSIKNIAFESSSSADSIGTTDGILTHANPAFARMWGYKNVDEVIGKPILDFLADKEKAIEIVESIINTGKWSGEYKALRKDGSTFVALSYANAIKDVDGNQTALYSSVMDITENKKAEKALQESEYLLKESQQVAQVGSYSLDIPGDLWISSQNLDDLFGIDENYNKDIQNWMQLVHPEDQAMMSDYFATDVLKNHESFNKEYRIQRNNDQQMRWMHGIGRLEIDDSGNPIKMIGTIQDITDRKIAEIEIQLLNEELEQRVLLRTSQLEEANKELESFSYSVSHDLRAPLRAIDGFSQILMDEYLTILPPEAQHYLDLVRKNTAEMDKLIDDLLAFSRLSKQEPAKQTISPNEIVNDVLEDLEVAMAGHQIELKISNLPDFQADPSLIKQVYLNLIDNAIKFSRGRDPARIEIGHLELEGEQIYFVKDNGVGFDMQYEDKLFGVFQRLHKTEDFEGTGVGLAIVLRIIRRHGGRIWAESEVDQGATFYFSLEGEIDNE